MKPCLHFLQTILCFAIPCFLCAQKSVTTQHNDLNRTGWTNGEIILTQSNVRPGSFGKLFTRTGDDKIYAQPLVIMNVNIPQKGLKNILLMVTQKNSVYAYDADAANVLTPYWQVNLTPAHTRPVQVADLLDCAQGGGKALENFGILSTPVVDTASGIVFLVTKIYDSISGKGQQYLHALNISTGAEKPGSPKMITASVAGTGTGSNGGVLEFDALHQNQRSGLLLLNNLVIICWGSHCDWEPYHGWIMAYDKNTLQQKLVYCDTPDGYEGGIWMCAGAPSADGSGNIYFASGNGNAGVQGDTLQLRNRGQSVVKIFPADTGFAVKDFFTPYNAFYLDTSDNDFTSQVMLVPGTKLAICGDKTGQIYVLNTDNMGQYHTNANQVAQSFNINAPLTLLASWSFYQGTQKEYAYLWAGGSSLKAVPFNRTKKKFVTDSIVSSQALMYAGVHGAGLSISSNGAIDSTAILWAYHVPSGNYNANKPGILRAFAANNINNELWNSSVIPADTAGLFSKFVCPAIANGKVYIATTSNKINVYGLTGGSPELCTTSNIAFGKQAFASTVNGNNAASLAVDGNGATAWVSAKNSPQYIYIDLGSKSAICKVKLAWGNASVKDFSIDVSDNAVNWKSIISIAANTSNSNTLLVSGAGRYVRMYATSLKNNASCVLNEFEVYGKPVTGIYASAKTNAVNKIE